MPEPTDVNAAVIDAIRANKGAVGDGAPDLLLLHHTGRRSGKVRVTPLGYQRDADRLIVFAVAGGAPTDPDWYRNLVANPLATVELGAETFGVRAIVATAEERARIWDRQKELTPVLADYERAASREIPVVILERTS